MDPRTFEIESSGWDSTDEMEDTTNSGSDVPYASSVRPITASVAPKAYASLAEESINFSAKTINPARDKTRMSN
ncbi:MAG: hypothetical protein Q8N79_03900 [Candidatus Methanoperedens sp.]|nr:hypothetical protein [Candidatus Methanoperedens sp.]